MADPSVIDHASLAVFQIPVRRWFAETFPGLTRPQELCWPVIASGKSVLVLSPTGSGKTLAAFLAAIDRIMFSPAPQKERACRVLYVSPLKALAVDVDKNLREPIAGIAWTASEMDYPVHRPTIALRTGDTSSRDRAAFLRKPSDILITTPESLYLLLTSQARDRLRSVEYVIIDEIHSVLGSKRGAHLAVSLERLEEITETPPQRIGLSATQRPLEEVARFLGGFRSSATPNVSDVPYTTESEVVTSQSQSVDTPGLQRDVVIIDAGRLRSLDLCVMTPAIQETSSDFEANADYQDPRKSRRSKAGSSAVTKSTPGGIARAGSRSSPSDASGIIGNEIGGEVLEDQIQSASTSIWTGIHALILDLVASHRSTIIFVNSRRLAERMAAALNTMAGEEIVHAHHGSISREQRKLIEDQLKEGRLPAIVATSSLELGIDMGAIDLVIQVEAPPSVASGMQRVGRAGHQVGGVSEGVIMPKHRSDLLACAALAGKMAAGQVEAIRYPRNPLDVLAQQIVAIVSLDDCYDQDVFALVRRSAPFAELPKALFDEVLEMLSGRYPSDAFSNLRPRITWMRSTGRLSARPGAWRTAIANAGTIPDRGAYSVYLSGAPKGHGRVGELDEELVFESKVGDSIVLGASAWRIDGITHDRVMVSPAPGTSGRMPFWHGDSAGRSPEFGQAIGNLIRNVMELSKSRAMGVLMADYFLDECAAETLFDYLNAQRRATTSVPDDRTIVIESSRDELGEWRVCLMSPCGARILAPWAMALGARIFDRYGAEADILWTDDGLVVRLPDREMEPDPGIFTIDPEEVEDLLVRQLGVGGGGARSVHHGAPVNALFATKFRENAARALLLPRQRPGRRVPLWQQRKRAMDLLHAVERFPKFPITLETFREIIQDVFEVPALIDVLTRIRSGDIKVVSVVTGAPSPFAASLLFHYTANFIYEGDAPLAERRAQALKIDLSQLRTLLGEAELRTLLDPEALLHVEERLQHVESNSRARHPDGLHDLLLDIGDMNLDDIASRITHPEMAAEWVDSLRCDLRILEISIGEEKRWIAAEDSARYRDALGVVLPSWLHASLLQPIESPLEDLVSRYARSHGPFTEAEIAARFHIGVETVRVMIGLLQSRGRVVAGHFRPDGTGEEICDSAVLRSIRQMSMANLRREMEPVDSATLCRFLVQWHLSPSDRGRGQPRLIDVIAQLEGLSLPASLLESSMLPARLPDYRPQDLDALMASGEVIWVGAGKRGAGQDGWVRLYRSETASLLHSSLDHGSLEPDTVHAAIIHALTSRGAMFFPQILIAVGGFPSAVVSALWDLVWQGLVSNDTLQPLRALLGRPDSERRRSQGRTRAGYLSRATLGGSRSTPPDVAGRWSLTSAMVWGAPSSTERLTAVCRQLFCCFGFVTSEVVSAAGLSGGLGTVYPVLKAMEEAGKVQRGFFVKSLGPLQFLQTDSVERLRRLRELDITAQVHVMSSVDPANPYGTVFPWPVRTNGRRAARTVGSEVYLWNGFLVGWRSPDGSQLLAYYGFESCSESKPIDLNFETTIARALATALSKPVKDAEQRAVAIKTVNGKPRADEPLHSALLDAGFNLRDGGYQIRM